MGLVVTGRRVNSSVDHQTEMLSSIMTTIDHAMLDSDHQARLFLSESQKARKSFMKKLEDTHQSYLKNQNPSSNFSLVHLDTDKLSELQSAFETGAITTLDSVLVASRPALTSLGNSGHSISEAFGKNGFQHHSYYTNSTMKEALFWAEFFNHRLEDSIESLIGLHKQTRPNAALLIAKIHKDLSSSMVQMNKAFNISITQAFKNIFDELDQSINVKRNDHNNAASSSLLANKFKNTQRKIKPVVDHLLGAMDELVLSFDDATNFVSLQTSATGKLMLTIPIIFTTIIYSFAGSLF